MKSLFLEVGVPGEIGPPLDVGLQKVGKLFGRVDGRRVKAETQQLVLDFLALQYLNAFLIQARDDRARHACPGHDAEPCRDVEVCIAEFSDGRHIGRQGRALRAGNAQRPQPSLADVWQR